MPGTQPFRIALIGAGLIARNAHLPAALSLADVQVTAVVDAVLERAQALAQLVPGALAAADVSQVRARVDGAVVCVPNHVHARVALECIDFGIPVLVEKPMGRSVQEAVSIGEAARRRGVPVAAGYATRFDGRWQLLKRLIHNRDFGRLQRFAVQSGSVAGYSPVSGYNLSVETAGGGVLLVLGSHLLDRVLWWLGPPQAFEYSDDSCGGPESHASATLFYEIGGVEVTGCVRVSKAAPLCCGTILETESGTLLTLDEADRPVQFRPRSPSRFVADLSDSGTGIGYHSVFAAQLQNFVDSVRGAKAPLCGVEDCIGVHRLVEAFYAHRGRGRVSFNAEQEAA